MDRCQEEMMEDQQSKKLYRVDRTMRASFGREADAQVPDEIVALVEQLSNDDPASSVQSN